MATASAQAQSPGSRLLWTSNVPGLEDFAASRPGGCPGGSGSELRCRAFQGQRGPCLGLPPGVLGSFSGMKAGLGHHWPQAQGPAL